MTSVLPAGGSAGGRPVCTVYGSSHTGEPRSLWTRLAAQTALSRSLNISRLGHRAVRQTTPVSVALGAHFFFQMHTQPAITEELMHSSTLNPANQPPRNHRSSVRLWARQAASGLRLQSPFCPSSSSTRCSSPKHHLFSKARTYPRNPRTRRIHCPVWSCW